MTAETTWQCPNCGEEHPHEFETCWKCGTSRAGDRDPEFVVSEPVRELDQAAEPPPGEAELPSLQLPLVTYFSIPVCIGLFVARAIVVALDLKLGQASVFSWSPIDVLLYCIGLLSIGIPMLAVTFRAMYLCLMRRRRPPTGVAALWWLLSMIQFPEDLRQSHRWFVPVYYGSFVVWLLTPPILLAWQLVRAA